MSVWRPTEEAAERAIERQDNLRRRLGGKIRLDARDAELLRRVRAAMQSGLDEISAVRAVCAAMRMRESVAYTRLDIIEMLLLYLKR